VADVWYRTGTFLTPASGTTVISTPDNPKAIHVWFTDANANDTNEVGNSFGHGFGDGTDEISCAIAAQDGATDTRRHGIGTVGGTGNLIGILDPAADLSAGSGTLKVIATTAAMNASDITISYSTFTANIIIHYECWGGTDVNANLFEMPDVGSASSPDAHGLSNKPDLVMFVTNGQAHPANSIHAYMSFGIAHDNGASIDQWALFSYLGDTGIGDGQGSGLAPGLNAGQYNIDFTNWTNTITVIDATNIEWTSTGSGTTDDMLVLALDLGGIGVDVGTFTKSTGGAPVSQSLPDLGFTPQGYHLATANKTVTTITADDSTEAFHGAVDESNNSGHCCGMVGVTQADRNSRSKANDILFAAEGLDGGVDFSGTHATINDSTPSIEWNPNTAVACHIGYYAFETQAAPELSAHGMVVVH